MPLHRIGDSARLKSPPGHLKYTNENAYISFFLEIGTHFHRIY